MRPTARKRKNQRGNIALLSAMLLVPTVGAIGGATDVIRIKTADAQLRSALESAALAAANLTNPRDVSDVVAEYVDINLPAGTRKESLRVTIPSTTVALNSKEVTIVAAVDVETNFLKLFGMNTITVSAETRAIQSSTNVELALVLDISSSMRGTKLENLKVAASDFVDQILNEDNIERTSINLVPFGGTVNIQELFDTYAVAEGDAIVDPTEAQYDIGLDVPNQLFRFTGADRCIEHPDADYDDGLLPEGARAQVPHFWKWNNFNPWCPQDESAVLLNTNDADALKERINGMLLSDGTGMDIGALWGAKALSPDWGGRLGGDFPDRPAVYDDVTQKVFVLMTDGEITPQYRPEDFTLLNTHTNRPTNNDPLTSHSGNSGNGNNQQTTLNKGNSATASTEDNAVGHFRRICETLKDRGAVIYTIGFNIKEGNLSDSLLEECATNPGNYYFVEDLDIQAAFDSIAASVNALRIIG